MMYNLHKQMTNNACRVPVLFVTYNRLDFTKIALKALLKSNCGRIIVFDNHSTDGTQEWLKSLHNRKLKIVLNDTNLGITGAMNYLFSVTKRKKYIAKVDNDTVVQKDWLEKLLKVANQRQLDIVQAKHPILKKSHSSGSFDAWMKTMERDEINPKVYYSNHVGGSGIIIRRKVVGAEKLDSDWVLGGWDLFQYNHPELKKAFYSGTQLKLLDTYEGGTRYNKYKNYYIETGRLAAAKA
jgi:GT2 family glycosyltransferase